VNPFERWNLRLASLAIIVSGFALLWMKYGLESTDPFAVINHPLQPWALKSHVLVAPALVFAIGLIARRHIWRHLVRRVEPGRGTGLATLISLVPMAASGYALQVIVSESWRTAAVVTHVASSVLFTVVVLAHFVLMRGYLRELQDETFCEQVRMKESLGLESGEPLRSRRQPSAAPTGEIDERDSTEGNLAEAGRTAR